MNTDTHFITSPKTWRYSTYGTLSNKTKYFWLCLHGSKMRCEQMLYKFADFDPETHFVVAPEGANRTYLTGFGGEVVASWMTSRDRLKEIEDFSTFLTSVYQKYIEQLPNDTKKVVMGFSQGGTSLVRWLHGHAHQPDHILLYACWVPEDIDLSAAATPIQSYTIDYYYGEQDQYLTDEAVSRLLSNVEKQQLDITFHPYKGQHRVEKSILKEYVEKVLNR